SNWTCPGLMDTPKSAKVSAEGVNGGEGRKAEAAKIFGRVQGRDGAASTAQRQEHEPDGAGARDRRDRAQTLGRAGRGRSRTRSRRSIEAQRARRVGGAAA